MNQSSLDTQSFSALIAEVESQHAPTPPISYSTVDYLLWLRRKGVSLLATELNNSSSSETILIRLYDFFSNEINSLEQVVRRDTVHGLRNMDSSTTSENRYPTHGWLRPDQDE